MIVFKRKRDGANMEKKQELVSIIIPAYNAERSIVRCINSVAKQTYRNIEIIVINDGSTDKTLELLKKIECEHSNIKVINKRNGGVSKARNDGISNAKGKYIYFADSDYYINEDTISKMVEVQKKWCKIGRQNIYINIANELVGTTYHAFVDEYF